MIFKFAEPESVEVGDRVFDVYVQAKRVIDELDVKLGPMNILITSFSI
ncbi:malectin domain-containing carbohydrate-binding protein [Colwelliaceae bacterium 6471]